MTTDNTATLFEAAINADNAWANALNRAGMSRWSDGSSTGYFAELYAAKLAAFDAFRIAAFPHASR